MTVLKRKIARPDPWPPARRAAQSARLRAAQIWTRSTGPRTAEGKTISCRNNLKVGHYTTRQRLRLMLVNRALAAQSRWLGNLRQLRRAQKSGVTIPAVFHAALARWHHRVVMLLRFAIDRATSGNAMA